MKSMWISQAVQTVELLQHEADGHVHVAAARPAEALPAGLRLVEEDGALGQHGQGGFNAVVLGSRKVALDVDVVSYAQSIYKHPQLTRQRGRR